MKIAYRKATIEDAEGIAKVHIQSWKETYQGIVPDSYLEDMDVQQRTERWQTGTLSSPKKNEEAPTFVATHGGKIIGFATCGPNRQLEKLPYDGELWAIYLLEQYQGSGIGYKLFELCRGNLKGRSFKNMYAWVLKESPTIDWYIRTGGTILPHAAQVTLGGVGLEEVVVAWEAI